MKWAEQFESCLQHRAEPFQRSYLATTSIWRDNVEKTKMGNWNLLLLPDISFQSKIRFGFVIFSSHNCQLTDLEISQQQGGSSSDSRVWGMKSKSLRNYPINFKTSEKVETRSRSFGDCGQSFDSQPVRVNLIWTTCGCQQTMYAEKKTEIEELKCLSLFSENYTNVIHRLDYARGFFCR